MVIPIGQRKGCDFFSFSHGKQANLSICFYVFSCILRWDNGKCHVFSLDFTENALHFFFVTNGSEAILYIALRCFHRKTSQKILKLQLLTHTICFFCVKRFYSIQTCFFKSERHWFFRHRCIGNNGSKSFTHHCHIPEFHNVLGSAWWFYLIGMSMDFFDASVLGNQGSGSFLTNALYSWNVIRGITH